MDKTMVKYEITKMLFIIAMVMYLLYSSKLNAQFLSRKQSIMDNAKNQINDGLKEASRIGCILYSLILA